MRRSALLFVYRCMGTPVHEGQRQVDENINTRKLGRAGPVGVFAQGNFTTGDLWNRLRL